MLVETAVLHRRVGVPLVVVILAWSMLARIQEPALSPRLLLFWTAMEAALLGVLALLPLAWVLVRRPQSAEWLSRLTTRPFDLVVTMWMAITAYATAVTVMTAVVSYTVDRMFGRHLSGAATLMIGEGILFATPIAALAPGLAMLRLTPSHTVVLWSAVLVAAFWPGGPIPSGSLLNLHHADLSMTASRAEAFVASLLATVAGLLCSLAVTAGRVRA